MEITMELNQKIKLLPERKKADLLKYLDYLQSQEDSSFIEYVNERTRQAVQDRKNGKHFTSLEDFQREYA